MMTAADDARRTLAETLDVRRRTRRELNPTWYANLVVGTFFLGSALLSAVAGDGWPMAVYWLVGLTAGAALIIRFYVRREKALGVRSRGWDSSSTMLAALLAGVALANVVFSGDLQATMPLYAAALGIAGFALLWGDRYEWAVAIGLAAVATAILLVSPESPGIWSNLGTGLVLVGAGLAGRPRKP
jgi:hypothetical protein